MTFTDIAELKLRVLGTDAVKTFETLNASAKDVKDQLKEMELAGKKNTEEYRALGRVQRDIQEEIKKTTQGIDIQNASMKELEALMKRKSLELKKLTVGSAEWVAKLKEIEPIRVKMDEANTAIRNIGKSTDDATKNTSLLGNAWSRVKDVAAGALAALSLDRLLDATIDFVRTGIKGAAELSDAFAKVQKTTGMTKAEVEGMNDAIKKLDTRTMQSDLLKIGEVGGQIGVAKDEMLGFVEATDKAVVALGDEFSGGAEEVTKKLGPLKILFKETKDLEFGDAVNKIGSALNELGAEGTATAPVVADFAARMGQLGDLSPQISQVMGLGASFQELGLTAEISSGGVGNILLGAAKATELFSKQVGLTEQAFKDLINTNPNEVLLKLAESFRGMPTDKVVKQLDELGIKSQEATKVMSLLKDQTALVREKQELANRAMAEGTSLTKEFNIVNNTEAAQLEKAQKALENKRVELGQRLLPTYIAITKAGTAFTGFLAESGERFLKLGVAVGAYVALQKAQILWSQKQVLLEGVKATLEKAKLILKGQMIIAMEAYTGMTIAETEAQIAATVAARGFNAALMANPFTIILTALTALFAGYQLYKIAVGEAQEVQAELNKKVAEAKAPLELERLEFNKLAKEVLNTNLKTEDRKKLLDELKAKYPLQLKGIDDLSDAEKNLGKIIRQTNFDFVTRAKLLENEVKITYNNSLATKALTERIELENKLKNASNKATSMVTGTAGQVMTYDSEAESIKKLIAQKDKLVATTQKNNADLAKFSENLTTKLNFDNTVKAKSDTKYASNNIEGQKDITKTTEGETKKREKINEESRKKDLDRFNELYDELQVLYKEHQQTMKEFDEKLLKERVGRNKKMSDAISEIEKNIAKTTKDEQSASAKHQVSIADGLKNRITQYYKDIEDLRQKNNAAEEAAAKKNEEIKQAALNVAYEFASQLFSIYNDSLSRQLSAATTATEKAVIENKQAWSSIGQSAVGALTDLASGNLVGAIIGGVKTLFTALDNWVSASHNIHMAQLEDLKASLKEAGLAFMDLASGFITQDDVDRLNQIYESLIKISEIPPVRLDLGENDSYERRLQQELEIGASIVKNHEVAVSKEDELFDKSIANQEKFHSDALKKINDQYQAAVNGINMRYDWEQQMANRTFDLQSLGIQNQTNAELMALVTNNETKLGLTTDYEAKKAFIMNTFADQIKPITADMSQAEIDGINRATEARDAQLAKLSTWLTGELTFVINNEGQKRKEYSATELIISNGQKALEDLSIKHSAAEIARATARNIELAAAETKKKTDTEAAEKSHLDIMTALNKTYNDTLTALGLAKDAALAESFRILNDIVNKGYDDIIAKAQQAYNEGKLTADQYNEIANRLFTIKGMLGQIDWSKLTIPSLPNFDFTLPKFSLGTEYVDAANRYPQGTDTVPAYLNKGERVISAPDNAQLRGISNKDIVGMVMRSNLYRNGPHISTSAGSMVNLANPASVHHATNITQQFSTTALEGGMGALAKELQAQSKLLEIIASKDPSINFHALKQAFQDDADITARASF